MFRNATPKLLIQVYYAAEKKSVLPLSINCRQATTIAFKNKILLQCVVLKVECALGKNSWNHLSSMLINPKHPHFATETMTYHSCWVKKFCTMLFRERRSPIERAPGPDTKSAGARHKECRAPVPAPGPDTKSAGPRQTDRRAPTQRAPGSDTQIVGPRQTVESARPGTQTAGAWKTESCERTEGTDTVSRQRAPGPDTRPRHKERGHPHKPRQKERRPPVAAAVQY